MDDFSLNSLQESRNEYCSRLITILTPCIIDGVKSIFDESWKLCIENDEKAKYFESANQNVFLVDKKNKVQVNLKATDDDVREGICEWLQKTTGTKIVGFYLTPIANAKAALKRRLFTDELNKIRSN